MTGKRIVIVGNGRMAQSAAAILLNRDPGCLKRVVANAGRGTAHARLSKFSSAHGVPFETSASINDADVVARIAAERPDLILSIDNFQIFGRTLLGIPKQACINFHNGPIERYRGVNVPSWAIFNGEREHGVSWHEMEANVDTGALVAAQRFALRGDETALALTLECVRVGIALFETHLDELLAGRGSPITAHDDVRLYKARDLPNDGILDLRWPYARIDRMLRATDFRPFPNTFTYSKLEFERGPLIVNEARAVAATARCEPGEIVAADDKLVVACADRHLEITTVMLEPDRETDVAAAIDTLGLERGQVALTAH